MGCPSLLRVLRTSALARIPPPRRPRPPDSTALANRFFGSKTSLSLIHRTGTRPSLPFLGLHKHGELDSRLRFSTEQKDWFKYQMRLSLYWTAMVWTVVGGLTITFLFLREDWLDRLHPSPEDWSFIAKTSWRHARHEQAEIDYGQSSVDWGLVASMLYRVVIALENGGGFLLGEKLFLSTNDEWETYDFPGFDKDLVLREPISQIGPCPLSRIGLDVSQRSGAWRRCYVETLMGMAKAAELHDGWVRDRSCYRLFPKGQMVGPSNPYPQPVWASGASAPLEENCEQAYEDPSFYYIRILTTKGLMRRQRLEAGLAYAHWLDYKGDGETATLLYNWCMGLAWKGTTKATAPASNINITTGAASFTHSPEVGSPPVTGNIVRATTATASHHARLGHISEALQMYLSLLRIYQDSPTSPVAGQETGPDLSLSSMSSVMSWIKVLPTAVAEPAAAPSGDEPFLLDASNACEEAALMTYIGEILFSSAPSNRSTIQDRKLEGLSWTKKAVSLAETTRSTTTLPAEGRRFCAQCLETGLDNWWKMVKIVSEDEGMRRDGGRASRLARIPWLGNAMSESTGDSIDWEQEREMVQRKRGSFKERLLMEQLDRQIRNKSDWFAV